MSHDDANIMAAPGARPAPHHDDWPGIKQALAVFVWGEYFAEKTAARVASAEFQQELFTQSRKLTCSMLRQVRDEVRAAIQEWQSDGDFGKLWNHTWRLGTLFIQIGRSLGLLRVATVHSADLYVGFFHETTEIWPAWEEVARSLSLGLDRGTEQGLHGLPHLEALVELAYQRAGFAPRITPQGLWLGVGRTI